MYDTVIADNGSFCDYWFNHENTFKVLNIHAKLNLYLLSVKNLEMYILHFSPQLNRHAAMPLQTHCLYWYFC